MRTIHHEEEHPPPGGPERGRGQALPADAVEIADECQGGRRLQERHVQLDRGREP